MSSHRDLGADDLQLSLVVCTKNRPHQISLLLDSLRDQTPHNFSSIIIVDGSSSDDTEKVVRFSSEFRNKDTNFIYLRTCGGKPSGLNLAIDYIDQHLTSTDGVLFCDDDIYFRVSDFYYALEYLLQNNLCGLSPLIINENSIVEVNSRLLKPPYKRKLEGTITKSGNNVWVNMIFGEEDEWVGTSWLPGGVTLYDFQKIRGLHFSTELENSTLNGYALGDDVDFALRALDRGQIGVLRSVQVIHSSPLTTPRDEVKLAEASGFWKAHLVNNYPKKVSQIGVFGFELSRFILELFRSRNLHGSTLRIIAFFRGYFSNRKPPIRTKQ